MTKICSKCKVERPLTDFRIDKRTNKLTNPCKPCSNAQKQEARQNPAYKEKERLQRIEYRAKPETKLLKQEYGKEYRSRPGFAEHSKEYQAQWYLDNREEKLRKNYESDKARLENDPNFKLRKTLRSRLKSALKNNIKSDSTMSLLGCNVTFLKKWLESQFDDKMTWDNHGSYWHIDHVRPCASFDLTIEEEQRKCFNWRNLQPLEKSENLSKKDKIDEILIEWQNLLAEIFLESNPL